MALLFDVDSFIRREITGRGESLLQPDLSRFSADISAAVKNKSVLVIGAAGTIGSSFIKSLLRYEPGKLVVVDVNENGLTELVRDCRSSNEISLPKDFKSYPVDFGEKVFTRIFHQEAPFDIVANFAAHKHVRSEKDVFSIEAMIENNVFKADRLLELLSKTPPSHFFCVSTDKAANPVNIMGASKKLMEELILAYSEKFKITTARFANVAFSNGSLLAGFLERLSKRQPLSCPSDVKRFFVSPQEAGEICLCACVLGNSGDIFFPKLDPARDLVTFASAVEPFLREFGFTPGICSSEEEARRRMKNLDGKKYPVYFFESDTSGEKLYEEFYTDEEELDLNSFQSLGIIKNSKKRDISELEDIISKIAGIFSGTATKQEVVDALKALLPGFEHVETGINLDQKM